MTPLPEKVIDSVHVRFMKTGNDAPSIPRPARIIVTATGNIEISSVDGKFPPIHLNAANVVKPKRPLSKNTTWISLNIIQNVEAKYKFVNIQVNTPSEVEDLYNTLMIAWTPKKIDLFNDDDSFSASDPAHVPPPIEKQTSAGGGRSARANITVEPEGSSHLGISSFYAKPTSLKNRKQLTSDTCSMTMMFDNYGIENADNAQSLGQVHAKSAPPPRLCVPETNKEREKVLELTAELEKVRIQWTDEVDKLKEQLNEERQKSAKLKQDNKRIKRNQLIRETIVLDDADEPPVKRRAEEEEPASSPEVAEIRQQLKQSEEKFQKLCDVARRDKEALQARVDFLETLIDSKEGIVKNANKASMEDELKKQLEDERQRSARLKKDNVLTKGQLLQLPQQLHKSISAVLEEEKEKIRASFDEEINVNEDDN